MAEKTAAQIKAEQEEAQRKRESDQKASERRSQAGSGTTPGAMTTYSSGQAVMEDPRGPDRFFTRDEIKSLAGDIGRGELAHIKLDEEGKPTGAAFRDIPGADDVTAPVYGTPTVVFDELVTPSGAPVTKYMNPEPKLWDAGMLARNPIPEPTEQQKKYRVQGGGVVNQPVTV